MSVRMRHTKGHTRNRRSHHALTEPRLAKCADCGELALKHTACSNCGKYRGRVVIDMEKAIVKKEEKAKRKKKELEQAGIKTEKAEQNEERKKSFDTAQDDSNESEKKAPKLDPNDLSKK